MPDYADDSERQFLRLRLELVDAWRADPDKEFVDDVPGRVRRRARPASRKRVRVRAPSAPVALGVRHTAERLMACNTSARRIEKSRIPSAGSEQRS